MIVGKTVFIVLGKENHFGGKAVFSGNPQKF